MIIERIRVRNFLSHAESEVDFTDAPLWLICGQNGAGKSALFDAVEYALYGSHRGGGQQHGLLVKQGQSRGLVELTIRSGQRRVRVRQHLDAAKGNLTGELAEWRDGAGWEVRNPGDGARAIWQWLRQHLHLPTDDLFHSAIFLRQGQTAHFFSGSPKERLERFAALLDLSRYSSVAEQAKLRAARARERQRTLQARREALGDVSDEALAALERLLEAAAGRLQTEQQQLAAAEAMRVGAERWATLQATREALLDRRGDAETLLADEAAIRAAAARVAAWDSAVADLTSYWRERVRMSECLASAARTKAEADRVTAERDACRAVRDADGAQLSALIVNLLPGARKQRDEARARTERLAREVRIAEARESLAAASAGLARLAGADRELADWRSRQFALPLLRRVADALAERSAALARREPRDAALEQAKLAWDRAKAELHDAEAEVAKAREASAAAATRENELAPVVFKLEGMIGKHRTLTGDEPTCPVCAQPLNDDAHAHVRGVLAAELARATELTDALAQAREAVSVADRSREEAEQREDKARHAQIAAERAVQRAEHEVERDQDLLEQAERALREAQVAVRDHHPAYADCLESATADWLGKESAHVEACLRAAEVANEEYAQARDGEIRARTTLELLHGQREPGAEPLGDSAAVSVVRLQAEAAAEEARGCEAEVARLEEEEQALRKRLETAGADLARLDERIAGLQERAATAQRDATVADEAADRLSDRLGPAWADVIATQEAYEGERQEVEALRPQAGRLPDLNDARAQLRMLDEQMEDNAAELEAVNGSHRIAVEIAQDRETTARAAERTADAAQRDLVARRGDMLVRRGAAEEYRQEIAAADLEATTHEDLFTLLREGGALQSEIVRTEQERIAGEVNQVLARLGDPLRVGLGQPRRASGRVQIKDVHILDTSDPAAKPRFFEFLSGGEQFRTALALALALHRRVGGGIAGTIIVDEGFGMLDGDRRDELARQITDASEGFLRLGLAENIIICSHSSEVQRYFPHRWLISKEGGTAQAVRPEADGADAAVL